MLVLWLAVVLGCGKVTAYESCVESVEISCACGETEGCETDLLTEQKAEESCSGLDDKEAISDESAAYNECYNSEMEQTCDKQDATATCCDMEEHSSICG